MDLLLAPDVYVNASVAPQTPPDKVVQRVLGEHKGECAVSKWILDRVGAILTAVPEFKPEAVEAQLKVIKQLVREVEVEGEFGPDAWADALTAAAKKAGAVRVITDHPDLLEIEDGEVEFISTEAWLLEKQMPPPPPV